MFQAELVRLQQIEQRYLGNSETTVTASDMVDLCLVLKSLVTRLEVIASSVVRTIT